MPNYKYQTDDGTVVRIKLSAAKFAQAGTEPTAAIGQAGWNISASTSKRSLTRRKARGWIFTRTEAVGSTGRSLVTSFFFPKMTPAAFNEAPPTAAITYKTFSLVFSTKSSEG